MNTKPVIVEETINAPVEKVWQAITDKEKMKQWYFNLDEFEPVTGFALTFEGEGHKGEKYVHICKITEVIPHKKLQYSWQYEHHEGYSLVTFELVAESEQQTRVKVTHEGLDTFPQGNPDFAAESFTGGWNHLIRTSLKKFAENNQ